MTSKPALHVTPHPLPPPTRLLLSSFWEPSAQCGHPMYIPPIPTCTWVGLACHSRDQLMFNRAFIRSPHGVNFARETMSAARRGGSGCGCGCGGGQAADWHYSRAQVTRDSNASNPPSALARPPPRRPLECGRARASVRRAVAVASVSLDCADLNEWSWSPPRRASPPPSYPPLPPAAPAPVCLSAFLPPSFPPPR